MKNSEEIVYLTQEDIELLKNKMNQFWIIYPFIGFAYLMMSFFLYLQGYEGYTPFLYAAAMCSILLIAIPFVLIEKKKMQKDLDEGKKLRIIGKIDRKIMQRRSKMKDINYFVINEKFYDVDQHFTKFKLNDIVQIEITPNSKELLSLKMIEESKIPEDESKIETIKHVDPEPDNHF